MTYSPRCFSVDGPRPGGGRGAREGLAEAVEKTRGGAEQDLPPDFRSLAVKGDPEGDGTAGGIGEVDEELEFGETVVAEDLFLGIG